VPAITKVEVEFNETMTSTAHSAASYKNTESNDTLCGPITYSLIGSYAGLSYDAATRIFTFAPTAYNAE
jgi:hypothetical protein